MKKDKNKNKYNKNRLKLLLKGIIPSAIGIFLPKINNRIIFNSTINEFFDFNTKYLFEYFIKYHKEYECKFVINNEEKRKKLNEKYGVDNNYFIETETFKGMWYALRAKSWITSAFETPVGGFFLNINRFVFLLGHGTHFKAIVLNENNLSLLKKVYYNLIIYNFSKFLVTSEALVPVYKKAYRCSEKKLVVLGEPRHDSMFNPNISIIEKNFGRKVLSEKNILYAPTWRPNGVLKLFPFEDMSWDSFSDYLEKENINIYLRMHPSFPEDLGFYTKQSKRIKILDNNIVEDISEVLGFFDLLITDYSSIHISFLLLQKPVMFLPYDFEEYDKQMGFIDDYDKLTPGPKPTTLKEFQEEITLLLNDKSYYRDERIKISKFFNDYTYNNCNMSANYIIKKLKG